jgi:hypothetical protein
MRVTRAWLVRSIATVALMLAPFVALAMDTGQTKMADGLTVYVGALPAAMLARHAPAHPERQAHGGPPSGAHIYHIVIALFDAASGARVEDATVTARVASLGLAGTQKPLEPMRIADTITYGNYFNLPTKGPYRIDVEIARGTRTIKVAFDYEH